MQKAIFEKNQKKKQLRSNEKSNEKQQKLMLGPKALGPKIMNK